MGTSSTSLRSNAFVLSAHGPQSFADGLDEEWRDGKRKGSNRIAGCCNANLPHPIQVLRPPTRLHSGSDLV